MRLSRTNLEIRLKSYRDKKVASGTVLSDLKHIGSFDIPDDDSIKTRDSDTKDDLPLCFDIDSLDPDNIFHLSDIKKLCITYRLRFLDAGYFKGSYPPEAIEKIKRLEEVHDLTIDELKIVAPSKLLKLENADDPMLFTPLGFDYYYLIHKWGRDLHPLRRYLMWPYKTFENLVFSVIMVSVLLTALAPMQLFTDVVTMQEYLLMFLFIFKAVGGVVLFYGFAKGKNFNTAIWNSKYYNA